VTAAPWPTRAVPACLLCGSTNLRGEPFAYRFERAEFPGVRCGECGFVFLAVQPTAESFPDLYDARYFESDYHCGHETEAYFARESEQGASAGVLLDLIEKTVPRGRILEIGCAGGYFLKAARERGWSPTGIEVSVDASQFAREKLGLDVHTGTMDSVRMEQGSFDAVFMGDVLEHVPEPMHALRIARGLLRPGGVLLVAGPITIHSLDRRLGLAVYHAFGRKKLLHQPPYHLTEFTPGTLRFALERAGYRVARIVQSKIPPVVRNVRRRAPLEHALKFALDVPNALITRLTGKLGDRVLALAVKPAAD